MSEPFCICIDPDPSGTAHDDDCPAASLHDTERAETEMRPEDLLLSGETTGNFPHRWRVTLLHMPTDAVLAERRGWAWRYMSAVHASDRAWNELEAIADGLPAASVVRQTNGEEKR